MSTEDEKRALRARINEITARLSAQELHDASQRICRQVISLSEYAAAKRVFCFVATEREPDTREILLDALGSGKELYVPRCFARGEMEAARLSAMEELSCGRYGIPTSQGDAIEPSELDFIVAPALAFSESGLRLGRGGGYYDRYLSRVGCYVCGVCFSQCVLKELPAEKWDVSVSAVVTQERIIKKEL